MSERLRLVTGQKKTTSKKPDLAAEWIHPRLLHEWPDNPRKNQPVAQVVDSIKKFGFARPIVARRVNREIIAGHTAWKAAIEIGLDRVPVRFMDLDEPTAHRLAIADNRLGEIADWDMAPLHKIMGNWNVDDVKKVGFSEKDMRAVEKAAHANDEIVDESTPELPTNPITKLGDLWRLGNHRLVCGDATNAKHVKLARGELSPFIMVTDPPYGVNYDPGWRAKLKTQSAGTSVGVVENDSVADWTSAYKLFTGDVAYVWHDAMVGGLVEAGLVANKLRPRQQIVWVKQQMVFGRSTYHWQHECCWFAVRERSGVNARWCGERTQTTTWEIQNAGMMTGNRTEAKTNHSTQKPIECMARPMRNHGNAGDVVYDPFCGSGTAIIAAEQLDRVCVAIEVSPAYCDVIVERWQKLSSQKARRGA